MPTGGVCRVCLATNVRMMTIGGALQPVFKKLTDAPLHADGRPVVACYICHAQLLNAQRLMLRAVTAENALQDILDIYTEITESSVCSVDRRAAGLCPSLTISKLEYLDTLEPILAQVKTEVEINYVNGKTEDSEISEEDGFAQAAAASDVDSEKEVTGSAYAAAAYDVDIEVDVETVYPTEQTSTELLTELEDVEAKSSNDVRANGEVASLKGAVADHMTALRARAQCPCGRRFKLRRHLQRHLVVCPRSEKYVCSVCERQFVNKLDLERHTRNVHNSENKCNIYKRQYATEDQLQMHSSENLYETKPYKCRYCKKKFAIKYLVRHIRDRHRKSNVFECNICKYRYATEVQLERHVKLHSDKPYKCDNCQREFLHKSYLLKHNRDVHGENYKCRICQYQCATYDLLQSHVKVHCGERKWCRVCGLQFINNYVLRQHLRLHLTKKSYNCNQCPRKFIRNDHFERHLRSHTTENAVCKRSNKKRKLKYYECSICSQRYNQMANLKYHLNTHAGVKPFRCDVCQLPLTTKQSLKNHRLSKHGDKPFPCTECRRWFATREQLLAHTETHEPDDDDDEHTSIRDASADPGKIQCSLCPMQFSLKIAFRRHVISEHL